MKGKRKKIIFILLGLILFINISSIQGSQKVRFTILYTNDVMGEVEPCG